MSTNMKDISSVPQKRVYNYRFFTDKWMLLVVIWFCVVIYFKLMPAFITDVYLPFILCFFKFWWTKSSFIRVMDDKFVYCHKEIPTYMLKEFPAKNILRMYFKVLFFTTIDRQYCLVEYYDDNKEIKSLLLNLDRYTHPEFVRLTLISFCKNNNIEIIY
jgi:hypothetical protein